MMVFEKVSNNIYLYKEKAYFDVVVGAIVLPSKIIMIDSGVNLPKIKEFREYVENEANKKTEILFITHSHSDHTWGNQIFSDCKIIAAPEVKKLMQKEKENLTPENLERIKNMMDETINLDGLIITPPTETHEYLEIKDDDVTVIFKQTGGHTADSAYVFCEKYSVLFAGDNLFKDFFLYGQDKSSNPEKWLTAFEEYLALNVKYYIPGHQGICTNKTIQSYIDFLNLNKATIIEMHLENKTKEEIINKCSKLKPFPTTKNYPSLSRLKDATLENWYNFWIKK
jgi:glyoxylase-like metal-dependent hydrolase (beta-lactamase superfamily II)